MTSRNRFRAVAALVTSVVVGSLALVASASTQVTYDFNSTSDLATYFDGYTTGGVITAKTTGGIGSTGSIEVDPGDAFGVYTTKSGYSIGPVGSTYVFSAFMKSQGPNGYSGMGFTAQSASSGSTGGNPFRPTDALGISVHGGGFIFHDGANNYEGHWRSALGEDAAIGTVTSYDTADQMLGVGSGSASDWYKVELTIVRTSSTAMDSTVKVWFANADGTLADPNPKAEYTFNNRSATGILGASKIYSYFNLSGNRVYNFDNFSINLEGGVSVIAEDAPVVLTTDATESTGAIVADGSVTDAGASSVIERGFVYSTSAEPTIADNVVVVTGTTGDYTGTSDVVVNDTYHVRAYATNSTGTSYGAEVTVDIANGATPENTSGGSSGGSGSNGSTKLASTGFDGAALLVLGLGGLFVGGIAMVVARRARRSA